MLKKCKAAVLPLALALLLTACGGGSTTNPQPAEGIDSSATDVKLQIVTTIFPQYDFVREIAGDLVDLTLLVTPGAESHSFEPTPRDMITLQNSDLFIYVGGDSDAWIQRVVESLEMDDTTILTLMDMVEVVAEEVVEGMQTEAHGDDDEDDHDDEDEVELDEHVWTSPKNAILIVNQIAAELARLDTANAATYTANAQAYTEKLAALDADFEKLVATAPHSTLVFGDRFPFRYFADAYGLTYYAAFPGCSTDSQASNATIAFLIDTVRAENIPIVFTIEFSTGQIAEVICEETGARRLELHSVHNVTKAELEAGEGYLSLMQKNYENLKEALTR